MLAQCETMRIGFVSRKTRTDCENHVLLAVQPFNAHNLAQQMNITRKNMWGVFKTILDVVLKSGSGKYVLLKDPNRQMLRLYKMPMDEEVEGNDSEETESQAEE